MSKFKTKKATGILAVVSLISGFFFMANSGITGNVVKNHYYPVSVLSMIGLLLVFCSVILAIYTINKE